MKIRHAKIEEIAHSFPPMSPEAAARWEAACRRRSESTTRSAITQLSTKMDELIERVSPEEPRAEAIGFCV